MLYGGFYDSVSIPFSQALDCRNSSHYSTSMQVSIPFSQALDLLFQQSCFLFPLCFNSFQLGFRQVKLQRFFLIWALLFQFLLVRLQTQLVLQNSILQLSSFNSFQLGFRLRINAKTQFQGSVSIPFSQALDWIICSCQTCISNAVSIPFSQALD